MKRSGKGIEQIIYAVVSLAVSYAVSYFTKPDLKANEASADLTPTTTASRGAYIPLIIGRRPAEPIIMLAGGVTAYETYETVRTGLFNQKRIRTGFLYNERFVHGLCVGPGYALWSIRDNGALIFDTPIFRATTPSGSSFTCTDSSTFRIYWGDDDNVIDPVVLQYGTVATRYPGLMYIVWDSKFKGTTVQAGRVEYDLTGVVCEGTDLGADSYITTADDRTGVNPAFAAWMVATGEYPWGSGLEPGLLDRTSLASWATEAVDEALPINITLSEGDTAGSLYEALARDLGYGYVQIGSRLTFRPLRKPASRPTLDNDRVSGFPRPSRTGETTQPNRRFYTFPDVDHRFNRNAVESPSNGVANRQRGYITVTDSLSTTIDEETANRIADIRSTYRRQLDGQTTMDVLRDGENLVPVDVFDYGGLTYRIGESRLDPVTGTSQIDVVEGLMTELVISGEPATSGTGSNNLDVEADPRVLVADLSPVNDDFPAIGVFRLRAHEQIVGAGLFVSGNSGPFTQIGGDYPNAAGGDLVSGESFPDARPTGVWESDTTYAVDDIVYGNGMIQKVTQAGQSAINGPPPWPNQPGVETDDGTVTWTSEAVENGPIIRPVGPDIGDVQDLSSDTLAWAENGQLAVFSNGAVMSLRNITAQAAADGNRADSTVYTTDSEILPVGFSTGLVYVNEGASGTSDSAQPSAANWRIDEGDTVTDGTVTWTARWPRYQLKGLMWTDFDDLVVSNLTTDDGVYIVRGRFLDTIEDARIASGETAAVKTLPRTTREEIAIGDITAVQVTPA